MNSHASSPAVGRGAPSKIAFTFLPQFSFYPELLSRYVKYVKLRYRFSMDETMFPGYRFFSFQCIKVFFIAFFSLFCPLKLIAGQASFSSQIQPDEGRFVKDPVAKMVSVEGIFRLIPRDHLIEGSQVRTEIEFLGSSTTPMFYLHHDIDVSSLSWDGNKAVWDKRGDQVFIFPPKGWVGKRVSLQWKYQGDPSKIQSGNVVWDYIGKEGCYFKSAANWYPNLGINMPAMASMTILAPASWTIVTQGKLVASIPSNLETSWTFSTDKPSDGFSLVGGELVGAQADFDGVKVQVLLTREHQSKLEKYMELLKSILQYYSARFSPFPFSKMIMAEVEGKFPMGYGSQELLVMTGLEFEKFLADPGFVAHETAHQWWGNKVMAKFPQSNWLNEGFATFSQMEFVKYKFGLGAYIDDLTKHRETYLPVVGTPLDLPIKSDEVMRSPAYQAIMYDKGALVLRGLANWLGEEVFWKLIDTHLKRNAGRVVTRGFFKP
ncbi:hypothetical protein HYY75_04110 [bacterium]|nr:hypothetical protein [bacterium]